MSETSLLFINPAIIERIENNAFVPARRAAGQHRDDRRNRLSPLAITRRSIRYEPRVFISRRAELLKIARVLNAPEQKIILLGGPTGIGKTGLMRGVIELMGGGDEQLLWFDVNRHTDFEEIIRFLVRYITEIAQVVKADDPSGGVPGEEDESPLRRLEALMRRMADTPLLIVLDNVEYLVDAERRFNSYPFKEMLNFLLGFPNVKMALIGERLPDADLSPNMEGILTIRLSGLSEADGAALLSAGEPSAAEPSARSEHALQMEQETLRQLSRKTGGAPWLLKILRQLHHQASLPFDTLDRLLESGSGETPLDMLTRYIDDRLSDAHRRLLRTMAFLRHPVDVETLRALMFLVYPAIGDAEPDRRNIEEMLEHSLLRGFLHISHPPQEVLAHIRRAREEPFRASYTLRSPVRKSLYEHLSREERERVHDELQTFYLREKSREGADRISKLPTRVLIAEARYHEGLARPRTPGAPPLTVRSTPHAVALPEDFTSRAYLSQSEARSPHTQSNPNVLTLADYRNISLPEPTTPVSENSAAVEGPAHAPQPEGSFIAHLEEAARHPSIQERLAQIESAEALPLPAQEADQAGEPDLRQWAEEVWSDASTAFESGAEEETEREIRQQLSEAVEQRNRAAMLRQLVALARYRAEHGRYESAAKCLEKAMEMKEEAGRPLLSEIYQLAGLVYKATYHHNKALSSLTRAAGLIHKLMYTDDTVNIAWLRNLGDVYQNMGEIYAYRSRYDEAADAFTQALRWYVSVDEPARLAEVHFRLAGVQEERDQPEAAISEYRQALALDEAQGNASSAAASLANLGYLYRNEGRWEEAVDCFRRALDYDRQADDWEGQFSTLDAMITIDLLRENLEAAETLAQQGLALAVRHGESLWQASFYMRLGQIEEFREHWDAALRHFQRALSSGDADLSEESREWLESKIVETTDLCQP